MQINIHIKDIPLSLFVISWGRHEGLRLSILPTLFLLAPLLCRDWKAKAYTDQYSLHIRFIWKLDFPQVHTLTWYVEGESKAEDIFLLIQVLTFFFSISKCGGTAVFSWMSISASATHLGSIRRGCNSGGNGPGSRITVLTVCSWSQQSWKWPLEPPQASALSWCRRNHSEDPI